MCGNDGVRAEPIRMRLSAKALRTVLVVVVVFLGNVFACVWSPIFTRVGPNFSIAVDRDGQAVQDAKIDLVRVQDLFHENADFKPVELGPFITNKDGVASLTSIPEGTYEASYAVNGLGAFAFIRVVAPAEVAKPTESYSSDRVLAPGSAVRILWPVHQIVSSRALAGRLSSEEGKYSKIEFTVHGINDSQRIPLPVGADGTFGLTQNAPDGLYVGKVTFLLDIPAGKKSSRGNISGMVVGPSGIVISGSKVTLSNGDTARVDTTDQDGRFLFPLLPPGSYRLLVQESNDRAGEVKEAQVFAGKTTLIRISLRATGSVEKVATTTLEVDARTFIFPLKISWQSPHQDLYVKFGERICGLDQEYSQMDTD